MARAAKLGPGRTADLARWRQRVGVLAYDETVADKWGQLQASSGRSKPAQVTAATAALQS